MSLEWRHLEVYRESDGAARELLEGVCGDAGGQVKGGPLWPDTAAQERGSVTKMATNCQCQVLITLNTSEPTKV